MVVNKKKQSEFLKSLDRKKKQEKQLEKQSKKLNNQQKKQNEQKKKQSGGGKKRGSANRGVSQGNSQKSNADKLGIGFRNQKSGVEKFGMGFGKAAKATQSKLNKGQKKSGYNAANQSNADKLGIGFQKKTETKTQNTGKSLVQNPFTDKVISEESIKRTKAQTDLTLKNGFASPKSESLRHEKDEAINPYKKSMAKQKLAASVLDDEYKRVRTAHPDMDESEILRFLASRGDYGQAFVNEANKRIEQHNQRVADMKNQEAATNRQNLNSIGMQEKRYQITGKNFAEDLTVGDAKKLLEADWGLQAGYPAFPNYNYDEYVRSLGKKADDALNTGEYDENDEALAYYLGERMRHGKAYGHIADYEKRGDSALSSDELFARKAKEMGLTQIGLAFQNLAFQTGSNKEKAKKTAQKVWSEFKAAGGGDVLQAIKYMDDNLLGVEASVLLDEVKKIADAERRQYVQQNLEAAQKQTRQNILSGANIDPRQIYESEEFQKNTDLNRAYNWMDATTATDNKLQNAGRAIGQGYLSAYAGAARLFGGERAANAVRQTDEMAIANKASAKTAAGKMGVDILSQVGLQAANLPFMALGGGVGQIAEGLGYMKAAKALQIGITGLGYGTSSAGQELQHAYDAGATKEQARASAAVSGILEVLFGGMSEARFVKAFNGDIKAGGKYITNALKRVLSEAGISAGMEGSTEYLTSVGQQTAARFIYDNPEGKSFLEILGEEAVNKDNLYAGALGALMGGGMGAVGGVGGYQAAKQRILVKEFAQKAGMSEQDVMAAVREGRIRELASFANDKADAKSQAVKFIGSVQKSIKGETSSSEILVVNQKTPRILQKYGAENRPLTMSQSVVRKIAYPEGYMGGKHNLGFAALAKLPEQLADPMAVLKSASQKNSLVIITELIDTGNRPVIVPIHLDKNGRIGLTNEVPSMYSKDGFSNFVKAQEKAGNILYTKKDRVLDDIPVNGLQLSEMGNQADPIFSKDRVLNELPRSGLQLSGLVAQADPIFNNSISQGARSMQDLSGKSLENYRRMSSFAEAKGGRIVVRNDLEAGNPGFIIKNDDGTFEIVVADEALTDYVVMGHELTHALEDTNEYIEYGFFIQNELKRRGVDIAAVKQAIVRAYAEQGKQLDGPGAVRELVAMYTAKHLFDDQVVINRLAVEKPSLFQRIWEWLQDMIAKLRGRDAAFYVDTRKRFIAAYRSAGGAHEGRWVQTGRQDMFVGVDPETGLRVYKSDFPESVPFAERKKIFKERIATIFNLGSVHLSTNSRKIIVNGDKFTEQKNIYGDKKSSVLGYATKINALYDLADILENSTYIGSGKEPSFDSDVISKNKAHENVKYWHYFESHIIFDGVPVDVLFNIRDKGNEQFQYLIEIKEKQNPNISNTVAVKQPPALNRLDSVNNIIRQTSQKNNNKTLENIDKNRQNSVEFDIDRIISLNQRGARRAWSDSVKEFDKVKKNVKTGGKQGKSLQGKSLQGKSLYEGLFEVLGKKGQQTEVLKGSLADVLGIETASGREAAASLEEKIGKKRTISLNDRRTYFESLFGEYKKSHGSKSMLGRTKLWQIFTTYLDDLQEANGLRRNMPRMKNVPRFEIGGKRKSGRIFENKNLENYRRMSSFAEARGGRIVVRDDLEPGNPGFIIKNDDGTFEIVVADEALADYVVMGHELTHALEGTDKYIEYGFFIINELRRQGADIAEIKQAIIRAYAEQGKQLDGPGAVRELVAMYTAKHLFDDQVVINRLAVERPSLFRRIWEWLQDAIAMVFGKKSAFYVNVRKRFIAAYRSAGGAHEGRWGEDTGRQDMIVDGPRGKYVKADRTIDFSGDKNAWIKNMGDYIFQNIIHNDKLDVKTYDGDILTINANTEWKLRDDGERKDKETGDITIPAMSDAEFKNKLLAAIHIDEIAEVSAYGKMGYVEDKKNHLFAKDGFNYRTAFLELPNGQYFKLKVVVGKNGHVKTIYHIDLNERSNPNNHGSSSGRSGGTLNGSSYGSATAGKTTNGVASNRSLTRKASENNINKTKNNGKNRQNSIKNGIFNNSLADQLKAKGFVSDKPQNSVEFDIDEIIRRSQKGGEVDKPQSGDRLFDRVAEKANVEFLAQALEHKIAGTLVDPREKRAVQMLDKVFGKAAKGGGENFRDFNRAKKDLSFEDLTEISGSDIINMESYSEIQAYFHDKYGIDVEGFDKKNIEDMRFVFAGIDDVLREFPDALGCMRKIVYNSKLEVYGKMNDRGVCQIGPNGIRSYGTGVHETIHALDFYRSDPDTYSFSEGIYKIALKELGLRKNSKQLYKFVFSITGATDINDYPEILAYAVETQKGKGIPNSLSKAIYECLKEIFFVR